MITSKNYKPLVAFIFSLSVIACKDTEVHQHEAEVLAAENIESNIFAKLVPIRSNTLDHLLAIDFVVKTKPGLISNDVHVSYGIDYLHSNGHIDLERNRVDIPIFGLYENYLNDVEIHFSWDDNERNVINLSLQTETYNSTHAISDITVEKQLEKPDFGFFLLDTRGSGPVIFDIDGEVRWHSYALNGTDAWITLDDNKGFIVGPRFEGKTLHRLGFTGEITNTITIDSDIYSTVHHDLQKGKTGLLATVEANENGVTKPESVLIEMLESGEVVDVWDFDKIILEAIESAGDTNQGDFVQDNVDWFHMNSIFFDEPSNSLILSSRENFVISIDYDSKKINWILGGSEKQWFQDYFSLRQLALNITGNAPVGQHAVSIVNGNLLLFDNGNGNRHLADVGDDRDYSAFTLYEIDDQARTAKVIFTDERDQELYSGTCSSVYRTQSNDYLVDYATIGTKTRRSGFAKILIVDDAKNIKYSVSIAKRDFDRSSCFTAYRAKEIRLDDFQLRLRN